MRLGGLIARLEATAETVNDYLSGELQTIEELDAPRLPDEGGAELNLINSTIETKIKRGSLANAYVWREIYSKSIK